MKVFIYDITSYVGKALMETLKDEDTRFFGSHVEGSPTPKTKKNIVSMHDDSALTEMVSKCDLVVCHLFQNLNDVHRIFRECRKKTIESTFVAISTLVTWGKNAHTAEKPLSEENFRDRTPDDIFIPIKALENTIVEGSTELLSSYVVACGVLYGRGEHYFDLMFKEGVCVPCYSGFWARNTIPTIHVSDVAKIVKACHESKPEKRYIVGLDKGQYSVRDVMSAISKKLGVSRLVNWNDEEAERHLYIYRGIGTAFQMDLNFDRESLAVNSDIGIEWSSENGIIRHMPLVIKEFISEHKLFPQRIVLLGPPASGKSFYARILSEKYFIPIVTAPKAIEYAQQDPKLSKLMAKSLGRKSNKTGRLPAPLLALVVRHMLLSPECRNKGYILDGYPRSYFEADCLLRKGGPDLEAKEEDITAEEGEATTEAAEGNLQESKEGEGEGEEEEGQEELKEEGADGEKEEEAEEEEAEIEEEDEEEGEDLTPDIDKKVIPGSVIFFDEGDDFLRGRIKSLSQKEVEGTHNDEENFSRRLALFRKKHQIGQNQTTLTFFEVNCRLEVMPIRSSTAQSSVLPSIELYIEKKKRPYNYHPTVEELQKSLEDEKEKKEAIRREREELQRLVQQKENEERESLEKSHKFRIDEILLQEQSLEDVRKQPIREYLMANVIPTLTSGLLETMKVKPDNEFDYLAEWLFRSISSET